MKFQFSMHFPKLKAGVRADTHDEAIYVKKQQCHYLGN